MTRDTDSARTLHSFMKTHLTIFRRADMLLERRTRYPKVQIMGRWASRPAKNDPLLREIQEAVKGMSIDRKVSSGATTLFDGQAAEKDELPGTSKQAPR